MSIRSLIKMCEQTEDCAKCPIYSWCIDTFKYGSLTDYFSESDAEELEYVERVVENWEKENRV